MILENNDIYLIIFKNHGKIIFASIRASFSLDEGHRVDGMFLASAARVVLPHGPRVIQIIIPRSGGKRETAMGRGGR